MQRTSRLAAVLVATVFAALATPASAFDYAMSGSATYQNLAVYFMRGAGATAAPLALDQALRDGSVKIYQDKSGLSVENFSAHSVFIQAGALLLGGVQDQVAGADFVVGPHSGRVPIPTLCVDPFRSTARAGENAKLFASAPGLFPSRVALLALLANSFHEGIASDMRQSAVWWSIDSLRLTLSKRLGAPLETPRTVRWEHVPLQDTGAISLQRTQRTPWTTSLPLALEDRRLARAQMAYVDALRAAGERGGPTGAVFAINGTIVGGDIYGSAALFRQMWPALLRSYATQAIAAAEVHPPAPPPAAQVTEFLEHADLGRVLWRPTDVQMSVRQSAAALVAETETNRGHTTLVHRSYVPRLAPAEAGLSPDAALVAALGRLALRSSDAVARDDTFVLDHDAAIDRWSVALGSERLAAATSLAAQPRHPPSIGGIARVIMHGLLFLAIAILLSSLMSPLARIVRHCVSLIAALGWRFASAVRASAIGTLTLLRAPFGGQPPAAAQDRSGAEPIVDEVGPVGGGATVACAVPIARRRRPGHWLRRKRFAGAATRFRVAVKAPKALCAAPAA
jgi:hypothetical protein